MLAAAFAGSLHALNRNYFKLSPYDNLGDVSKHSFWVSFSQVQCDLKDVAFYINKKSGFPKIKDSGYADVFLGGKGLSGKVHIESTGRKNHAFKVHAFKVVETKIKIDKLKFAPFLPSLSLSPH
ncbi:hypothetical protein JCM10213_005049 [Rhodosporidiobolus nylandii]